MQLDQLGNFFLDLVFLHTQGQNPWIGCTIISVRLVLTRGHFVEILITVVVSFPTRKQVAVFNVLVSRRINITEEHR